MRARAPRAAGDAQVNRPIAETGAFAPQRNWSATAPVRRVIAGDGRWGAATTCKDLPTGLPQLKNPAIVISLDGLTLHLWDQGGTFDHLPQGRRRARLRAVIRW